MDNSRDIAIQLTPPGAAAIAVIRLHGPGTAALLAGHFSKTPVLGKCVHGEIRDGDRIIDDAVVVLCGPTTADMNVHGGPWVVRSVLDLAARQGFQILQPTTPLAQQAVDSTSEIEQEILQYLPLARTELGVRILLAQQEAWNLMIERMSTGELSGHEIQSILDDPALTYLLYPPSVAIVGAANVGKSTLANQLFGQQRSITADVPGTTRDWVGGIANINGLPVMLLDTPGQRGTEDAIERAAIERAGHEIEKSNLAVLVLDCSRPFAGEQAQLERRYPTALKVLNKSDRPRAQDMPAMNDVETIATTGEGVDELRAQIFRFFCKQSAISLHQPFCWTGRQRDFLEARKKRPHGGG